MFWRYCAFVLLFLCVWIGFAWALAPQSGLVEKEIVVYTGGRDLKLQREFELSLREFGTKLGKTEGDSKKFLKDTYFKLMEFPEFIDQVDVLSFCVDSFVDFYKLEYFDDIVSLVLERKIRFSSSESGGLILLKLLKVHLKESDDLALKLVRARGFGRCSVSVLKQCLSELGEGLKKGKHFRKLQFFLLEDILAHFAYEGVSWSEIESLVPLKRMKSSVFPDQMKPTQDIFQHKLALYERLKKERRWDRTLRSSGMREMPWVYAWEDMRAMKVSQHSGRSGSLWMVEFADEEGRWGLKSIDMAHRAELEDLSLYILRRHFDVSSPGSRLVYDCWGHLYLATEIISGGRTLEDIFGKLFFKRYYKDRTIQEERANVWRAFVKTGKIEGLPVEGLFESFPYMLLIGDWDALKISNVMFKKEQRNGHWFWQAYWIDKDNALLRVLDGGGHYVKMNRIADHTDHVDEQRDLDHFLRPEFSGGYASVNYTYFPATGMWGYARSCELFDQGVALLVQKVRDNHGGFEDDIRHSDDLIVKSIWGSFLASDGLKRSAEGTYKRNGLVLWRYFQKKGLKVRISEELLDRAA